MQVLDVKTSASASRHLQAKRQPFFSKEGQDSFFSKSNESPTSFFSPTTVQPKLTIGAPDDKYEVEADAMADKVVQKMSEPDNESTITTDTAPEIQSKCTSCEEEELQKKEEDSLKDLEDTPEIQEKSIFESNTEDTIQEKTASPDTSIESTNADTESAATPTLQPIVQAKCEDCGEEEMLEGDEVQELQRKDAIGATGSPEDDEDPNVQLRSLEMEKTQYPILFKRMPNVQLKGSTASTESRERIVEEAQKMVGKIEAKKDDGSGRRVGADHLLEIFHLAANDAWSDEVIENVKYGEEFPHWCGIFSVYAIKKAGIDLGYWQIARGVGDTLQATDNPQPGDIGYFHEKQHHCIIKEVSGDTIVSFDGNSGTFSEVIEKTRPRGAFTGGFMTAFTGSQTLIQAKEEGGSNSDPTSGLENQLSATAGAGSALDSDTQREMEVGFGVDFSGVSIHTDSTAVQMNKDLNAQAFTHGNDIYFNEGKYNPESTEGKHLLAHELTHTVQQGGVENKTVQRYSFDEFVNDASNAVEAADQAIGDAGDTIVETASDVGNAVVDTAVDVGNTVVNTANDVKDAVTEGASDALSWISTTAGQAALSMARSIIAAFGGTIRIIGTNIVIDIPDVTLFDSFQKELGDDELPAIPIFEYPIYAGGAGAFAFLASLEVNLKPSILAALGPGELRKIRLTFNPFSGTFAGQAQLYMAAALGARLSIFGGLVGRGLTAIPTTPPIPILASLGGGIRGTGTGWGIGALSSMISVAYSSGGWSYGFNNDIMLGILLQGDLDLYAFAKVYELLVCEYAYPLGHWETGAAYNVNIPVHLGGGAPPSVGPITAGPMPIGNIETAIEPLSTGLNCKSLQEIVEDLCEEGYLPEEVCDILKEIVEDINEIGDDLGEDFEIGPMALKDCDDLPSSYRFNSYRAAENELRSRVGLPGSTRLYRNNKRATSGPCKRIGRHFNVWDNSGKRGQPLGAIGMCPCTTIDNAGNEIRIERFAVLNPRLYGTGDDFIGPMAKRWGCTDVRCNVYQIPGSGATCPDRVVGNAPYKYKSYDAACKAAQKNANSKVPKGCNKRHCNCTTKCKQK